MTRNFVWKYLLLSTGDLSTTQNVKIMPTDCFYFVDWCKLRFYRIFSFGLLKVNCWITNNCFQLCLHKRVSLLFWHWNSDISYTTNIIMLKTSCLSFWLKERECRMKIFTKGNVLVDFLNIKIWVRSEELLTPALLCHTPKYGCLDLSDQSLVGPRPMRVENSGLLEKSLVPHSL